jgi:type IV pilus biogenesis protein CpaD/CtpE
MSDAKMNNPNFTLILCAVLALTATGCASEDSNTANLATTPPYPVWANYSEDNHSNETTPYLGYTNHVNLVNMLDTPADMDQGRSLGYASGERETVVLKDYDQNKTSVFANPNAPAATSLMQALPTGGSQ